VAVLGYVVVALKVEGEVTLSVSIWVLIGAGLFLAATHVFGYRKYREQVEATEAVKKERGDVAALLMEKMKKRLGVVDEGVEPTSGKKKGRVDVQNLSDLSSVNAVTISVISVEPSVPWKTYDLTWEGGTSTVTAMNPKRTSHAVVTYMDRHGKDWLEGKPGGASCVTGRSSRSASLGEIHARRCARSWSASTARRWG
jgi:hypothetical protein